MNKVAKFTKAPTVSQMNKKVNELCDFTEDVVPHVNAPVEYIKGTQTAATDSWTGKTRATELTNGQLILYWLPYAGSGNATLNLTLAGGSTTGAKPIYRYGTTYVTTQYTANSRVFLVYDATIDAWYVQGDYGSTADTYNRTRWQNSIYALADIPAARVCVGTASGYRVAASGVVFDISYPILYNATAIDATKNGSNMYLSYPSVNFSSTHSIASGAAKKTIYLVGTLNGSSFTINSTVFTTAVPTADNGLYYIPLGVMSSATVGYFYPRPEVYAFSGGAFQQTSSEVVALQATVAGKPGLADVQALIEAELQKYLGHLTFSNISSISVTDPVWNGTMYISRNGENWSEWDGASFASGSDHMIYLRGSGNTKVSSQGHSFSFEAYDSNAGVTCEGNIETLLDAQTVAKGIHPAMASNCYRHMFSGCTSLAVAPSLPATVLASECYEYMFSGCTSLTVAPSLPAITLAEWCYRYMFQGCTGLTVAPSLPATTLTNSCYDSMFQGCTSLTTAPSLPATTIAASCYKAMFRECTKLVTLPALPATTMANSCYAQMFYGCTLIKLSTTATGNYTTPYRIPESGDGQSSVTTMFTSMFSGTGGTFKSNPTINTTYYTSNTVV